MSSARVGILSRSQCVNMVAENWYDLKVRFCLQFLNTPTMFAFILHTVSKFLNPPPCIDLTDIKHGEVQLNIYNQSEIQYCIKLSFLYQCRSSHIVHSIHIAHT